MTEIAILPFHRPYDWPALRSFLAERTVPGLEAVGPDSYARSITLGRRSGTISVSPTGEGDALAATIRFPDPKRLPAIRARLRHMFDLDAEPTAIARHLSRDAILAPLVAARPGLRVPGAWSGFELAIQAILGQQVSVSAARRLVCKLVEVFGTPLGPDAAAHGLTHAFPAPDALVEAEVSLILNMPRSRGAAIRNIAAAVIAEPDLFDLGQGLERAVGRLTALRGIGAWTAHYIAMRALREPDALPYGDIALLRALDQGSGRPSPKALAMRAEDWRPYRAYASMHLWASDAETIAASRAAQRDGADSRARVRMR